MPKENLDPIVTEVRAMPDHEVARWAKLGQQGFRQVAAEQELARRVFWRDFLSRGIVAWLALAISCVSLAVSLFNRNNEDSNTTKPHASLPKTAAALILPRQSQAATQQPRHQRAEFVQMLMGKSKSEVIALIGRPTSVHDGIKTGSQYYDYTGSVNVYDEATGMRLNYPSVWFDQEGFVVNINF